MCGSPGAVGVVGGSGKEGSWPAVGVGVGGGGVRKGKLLAGGGCRCWSGWSRKGKSLMGGGCRCWRRRQGYKDMELYEEKGWGVDGEQAWLILDMCKQEGSP